MHFGIVINETEENKRQVTFNKELTFQQVKKIVEEIFRPDLIF